RRRHTSSDRDWSSDVCSSDLPGGGGRRGALSVLFAPGAEPGVAENAFLNEVAAWMSGRLRSSGPLYPSPTLLQALENGPAPRERSEERRVGNEGRAWLATL